MQPDHRWLLITPSPLQAEAICVLIAGMSAFFPPPPWNVTPLPRNPSGEEKSRMAGLVAVHAREVSAARARPAWCLLLFACLRKQQAEAPPAMARFTHALMHWLAAQPCVSSLIVTSDADATAEPASSSLGPSLPRALGLPPMQVGAVQRSLREWLLLELRMEAEQGLKEEGPATGQPPRTPSACQQLMASLAQELLARASLVSKGKVAMDEPDTVRLLELAEQLLASATGLLAALPTQHGAALEAQQACYLVITPREHGAALDTQQVRNGVTLRAASPSYHSSPGEHRRDLPRLPAAVGGG